MRFKNHPMEELRIPNVLQAKEAAQEARREVARCRPWLRGRQQWIVRVTGHSRPQNAYWKARSGTARAAKPGGRPQYARFAAAMDAARIAEAPELSLYREQPLRGDLIRGGGRWHAPGRPLVRWLGIGSCILRFGVVLVALLTRPTGASIEPAEPGPLIRAHLPPLGTLAAVAPAGRPGASVTFTFGPVRTPRLPVFKPAAIGP